MQGRRRLVINGIQYRVVGHAAIKVEKFINCRPHKTDTNVFDNMEEVIFIQKESEDLVVMYRNELETV